MCCTSSNCIDSTNCVALALVTEGVNFVDKLMIAGFHDYLEKFVHPVGTFFWFCLFWCISIISRSVIDVSKEWNIRTITMEAKVNPLDCCVFSRDVIANLKDA